MLFVKKKVFGSIAIGGVLAGVCCFGATAQAGSWSIQPYGGLNYVSEPSGTAQGVGTADGAADIDLEAGFLAGIALAYQFDEHWSAEFAWDYRSAQSSVRLADGEFYEEGNFASNLLYLNGRYHFVTEGMLSPYLGAGFVLGQEIDLDLEQNGVEASFSSSGDIGAQLIGGTSWAVSNRLNLNAEVRYSHVGAVEMDSETAGSGQVKADYTPVTVQLGLVFEL